MFRLQTYVNRINFGGELSCLLRARHYVDPWESCRSTSCGRVLASEGDVVVEGVGAGTSEDLVICYTVRPFDAQNTHQAAHVESVDPPCLA